MKWIIVATDTGKYFDHFDKATGQPIFDKSASRAKWFDKEKELRETMFLIEKYGVHCYYDPAPSKKERR